MMHGASYFELSGDSCTAIYTDGSREAATLPAPLADQFRAYHAYQCENGPEAQPPNSFALVSAIQAQRNHP